MQVRSTNGVWSMVLYGMAWYCMVLYVIEWSWGFNSLLCELGGSYGLIMIALVLEN